jgi:hypothetical protein
MCLIILRNVAIISPGTKIIDTLKKSYLHALALCVSLTGPIGVSIVG